MAEEKSAKEMTINERIKFLRTKVLKMSQENFGQRIKMGRGGVDGIERNKHFNVTSRNFDEICRVYKINSQWLEKGEGEIFFKTTDSEYLEELSNEFGLGGLERQVLEKYLSFPSELRELIADWMLHSFDFVENLNRATAIKKHKEELENDIAKGQAAQEKLAKIKAEEQAALVKDTLSAAG